MKGQQAHTFTLMVDNEFGVLTRITALIRRAGWNIRSLAVAETAVPEISRLTIALECRGNAFRLVLDRLGRLDCVKNITLYSPDDQVTQELALLRLEQPLPSTVDAIQKSCLTQVLDEGDGSIVLSLTGEPAQIEAALELAKASGTVHIARTGAISIKNCKAEVHHAQ